MPSHPRPKRPPPGDRQRFIVEITTALRDRLRLAAARRSMGQSGHVSMSLVARELLEAHLPQR